MEKMVYEENPIAKLRLSEYLPHQSGKCGEVQDGLKFLDHLMIEHLGMCPAGSITNAHPTSSGSYGMMIQTLLDS